MQEDIKAQLFQLCLQFTEVRMETANTALRQAREASNDDTKSSAGDKYETSREMAQQDIDRNKRLLMDAEAQQQLLQSLKEVPPTDSIRNGSLVYTNQGNFYLSISAGQLHLDGTAFFAISAVSPIGKLLLGKKKNDLFEFNGKSYTIETHQ
jgi:transcription elongation GreA/GreB family factor